MRVAECAEFGPLDGLAIVERDDPVPGPGMVVVRVDAAGVNYVDALFVRGEYQIKPPLPFVPGSEIAGEVIAAGEGVDADLVGRRVVALCGLGGFAEQVAVPAAAAVPIPDVLDPPRAAAFIQSYCTARFALSRRAGLRSGERVLVLGAGGGVGQACVQVAVAAGATVVAVASTADKRRAAFAAGAEVVFDDRGRRAEPDGTVGEIPPERATDDATALVHLLRGWSNGGVDVAVDPVGGDLSLVALRSLGHFGRLLVIGFPAGIAKLPANQVLLRNRSVLGVDWGAWSMHEPDAQRELLEGLLADVAAGTLVPPAPEVRPLDQVVDALEDLVSRRVTGKLVLAP